MYMLNFRERKEKNIKGCKFSGYGYPRVRILWYPYLPR